MSKENAGLIIVTRYNHLDVIAKLQKQYNGEEIMVEYSFVKSFIKHFNGFTTVVNKWYDTDYNVPITFIIDEGSGILDILPLIEVVTSNEALTIYKMGEAGKLYSQAVETGEPVKIPDYLVDIAKGMFDGKDFELRDYNENVAVMATFYVGEDNTLYHGQTYLQVVNPSSLSFMA